MKYQGMHFCEACGKPRRFEGFEEYVSCGCYGNTTKLVKLLATVITGLGFKAKVERCQVRRYLPERDWREKFPPGYHEFTPQLRVAAHIDAAIAGADPKPLYAEEHRAAVRALIEALSVELAS